MFAFIWSCMVMSFKVLLGCFFIYFSIIIATIVISLLIVLLIELFKTRNGNPLGERKSDEDLDQWPRK